MTSHSTQISQCSLKLMNGGQHDNCECDNTHDCDTATEPDLGV